MKWDNFKDDGRTIVRRNIERLVLGKKITAFGNEFKLAFDQLKNG